MINNKNYYQKGFTLVELIVATFIFAIIALGVMNLSLYFLKNYSFNMEETQQIGQMQTTMTSIVREIREARIAENGAWPLAETNDNSFTFYADITNDNRTDKVRYFLENHQLKKSVIQPTDVPITYPMANEKIYIITDNVNNAEIPIFSYYNGDWPKDTVNNPLSLANRILNTRFVKIYLKLDIPTNNQTEPFELTSEVQIRSMKDNL